MTKRKAPEDRLIAPDDLTPKPRKKHKSNLTPEAKAKRIAALRASPSSSNNMALANPDRPLTDKQRAFAKFWAQGENIRAAAMRAGYTHDGAGIAYRMVTDPAILKIYNVEKALYAESCQMTRKKVMDGLLEGIEMAKLVSEPASVISGWREIGKMCGYYSEVTKKVEINVTGNITMKHLERASDAELLRLIKGEIEDVEFKETEEEEGE